MSNGTQKSKPQTKSWEDPVQIKIFIWESYFPHLNMKELGFVFLDVEVFAKYDS